MNMAGVISRGHLFLLQSSDFSFCYSLKFASDCFPPSAPLLRNSRRSSACGHVTCQCPPPLRFRGSRSESLAQSPTFNRPQICQTWSSRLRFTSCFHVRRGDGVRRSSLPVRDTAEAVAERIKASSRDAWNSGVSFNSTPDSVAEVDGERWTQSISVEPCATPPLKPDYMQHDIGMACAVMLGAFIWVRLVDYFTSKRIIEQKLSRKIVHITSGLLYMLCWPLFRYSSSRWAPYIVGLVPMANGIRLMIYGFGIWKDEGLVNSMSRSGESRELLRGPLYYVFVLYVSTVLFWRQSPIGMIALSMMCGGDGIADIMGRKFGFKKLPYNSDKSFAGSIAMFLFGFVVSCLCVYYFTAFGFFKLDLYSAAVRLALISLVATIVESLPITTKLDDNFTVPATAFLLGVLLFPSS